MKVAQWMATALLCMAGASHAQFATPGAGEYIFEGNNGTLTVRAGGHFSIETVAGGGHTCTLDGTIAQGKAKLQDSSCVVTFTPGAGQVVVVATNKSEQCSENCGVRAGFEGNYIRPTAACTAKAVTATRKSFKRLYDAKEYAAAQATLAPVLADCDKTLGRIDKDWIRNDLALAQLRTGDRAGCLKTLEPLREAAGRPDNDISLNYPPDEAKLLLPIVRAARTNLKLCQG